LKILREPDLLISVLNYFFQNLGAWWASRPKYFHLNNSKSLSINYFPSLFIHSSEIFLLISIHDNGNVNSLCTKIIYYRIQQ